MNKKPIIGLIDTGTSNIRSVSYALNECNSEVIHISKNLNTNIDALVVPGIGSFEYVMQKIKKEKLDKLILEKVEKIPSLFICVGMQILFTESYEFGHHKGLNLFNGKVKKIDENLNTPSGKRKVPFIGWNRISKKKECQIFQNVQNDEFFYFTHSYYVQPSDQDIISSEANYLDFKYCSSISKKNIYATQFHPEKKWKRGIKTLSKFY